jgi:hypothetical protein
MMAVTKRGVPALCSEERCRGGRPWRLPRDRRWHERIMRDGWLRQSAAGNGRCNRSGGRRSGFAMIDDMVLLKQAMEQMDAEDPVVAHAAKDRAAQALSDARLNFAKMAELIEQRRLLLQPRIVANIKRMDQPGMLGDIAFRNTGTALRREGQSFRQIAEAIERNGGPPPGYDDQAMPGEPLHYIASQPVERASRTAFGVVAAIILWPLRRPISLLAIALLAFLLIYAGHGFVALGRQVSGFFESVAAVENTAKKALLSVIGNKLVSRQSSEAPTPPAPIPSPAAASPSPTAASPSPSPSPATSPPAAAAAPVSPATVPAPAATASAPSVTPRAASRPPSVASAAPPVSTPGRKDITRHSRGAGPCVGGVGGCYWGGGRY